MKILEIFKNIPSNALKKSRGGSSNGDLVPLDLFPQLPGDGLHDLIGFLDVPQGGGREADEGQLIPSRIILVVPELLCVLEPQGYTRVVVRIHRVTHEILAGACPHELWKHASTHAKRNGPVVVRGDILVVPLDLVLDDILLCLLHWNLQLEGTITVLEVHLASRAAVPVKPHVGEELLVLRHAQIGKRGHIGSVGVDPSIALNLEKMIIGPRVRHAIPLQAEHLASWHRMSFIRPVHCILTSCK
jgi:hypothetical protein